MNRIGHIYLALPAFAVVLMLQHCGRGIPDDPRIARGKEMVELALSQRELGDAVKVQYEIDSRMEADPGDLNGETYRSVLEGNRLRITGSGPAGILYGSGEAARRILDFRPAETGTESLVDIPGFDILESPRMHLRGVGLLLMKLGTYNYPITPEEFPFFYDRELWIDYLDFLERNRYNYIAFWNGHPFSYFAHLPDYPEAQEGMPAGLLERNREQLKWLIKEAGKRNIRLFFEFYNIHTSVYFQDHHGLPDEISEPTPLLADYTAYSIEQFCRQFPEAGLYITAGEGLDPEYAVQWVNEVIMPAIERSGSNPPVMLRSWFLDMDHAERITGKYPGIYMERKYNVEMIAGTEIDPANRSWDRLTGRSVVNIHMAANLEPFRWNPPGYIRDCMASSLSAGADGIHLYPRKSWRWPYGCDLGDRSLQWERDRLWYEMWARYTWDPARESDTELEYWSGRLGRQTGNDTIARLLLEAFELSADALPAIQRLFWAGYDNHTVVTAGLLVAQIEMAEGIPFLPLDPVMPVNEYLSSPEGPEKEGRITPDSVLARKIAECEMALEYMDEALGMMDGDFHDGKNPGEWIRSYRDDTEATLLTLRFYREKLDAVRYRNLFLENPAVAEYRERFLEMLGHSVEIYRELNRLTESTYESLSDVPAINPVKLEVCPYHWSDLLPLYEREYGIYTELMAQVGGKDFRNPVYGGLAGIWYGDPGLRKPKFPFGTGRIDYAWKRDDQKPEGGRNWSVRWTGYLKGPVNGEVRFFADADQTVRVEISGIQVIDRSVPGPLPEGNETVTAGTMQMEEGKLYPVSIVYDHSGATSGHMILKWEYGEGGPEVIGEDFFRHSREDRFLVDRMLIRPAEDNGLTKQRNWKG